MSWTGLRRELVGTIGSRELTSGAGNRYHLTESQGLIVRVLGTCNSSMDGVTYPCVLSIERIPLSEDEVAGRLTKPEGYRLLEKVSSPSLARKTVLVGSQTPARMTGHVE